MFGLIFELTVFTGLDCAYITPTQTSAITTKTRSIVLVRTIVSPFESRRTELPCFTFEAAHTVHAVAPARNGIEG
jgi:hypothetical protein